MSGYCLVASAERGGRWLDLLQFYVRRLRHRAQQLAQLRRRLDLHGTTVH